MRRFALIVLAALVLASCGKAPPYKKESYVFGTRVEVLIAGLDEGQAGGAAAAVLAEFDRLHRTYHAWRPSELSALNAALAAGETAAATPEMMGFLKEAQALAAQSGGLFDPGIGELVRLWGFQSEEFGPEPPAASAIDGWRAARPGIAELALSEGRVASRNRHVAVDFGGYLKGVALDRAATLLRERGVKNALINVGGNVMALGDKNGEPWRVGLQHPRRAGPLATLALHDGEAIGTSGDYQRYFEWRGARYCHVLDPRNGWPITETQSLSVLIAPDEKAGTLSDAASKPLIIAGDAWPVEARKMHIEHVLRVDAAGRVQVTPALYKRLEFAEPRPEAIEVVAGIDGVEAR